MTFKTPAYLMAAIATPLLLVACASAPAPKEAADGAAESSNAIQVSSDAAAPLERRATDRWKLLIAKDGVRAYGYLTPGYRAKKTEKEYKDWVDSRPVKWLSAAYQEYSCDTPDSCRVNLFLTLETTLRGVSGAQQTFATIDERWLRLEGVWYHLPEDA